MEARHTGLGMDELPLKREGYRGKEKKKEKWQEKERDYLMSRFIWHVGAVFCCDCD